VRVVIRPQLRQLWALTCQVAAASQTACFLKQRAFSNSVLSQTACFLLRDTASALTCAVWGCTQTQSATVLRMTALDFHRVFSNDSFPHIVSFLKEHARAKLRRADERMALLLGGRREQAEEITESLAAERTLQQPAAEWLHHSMPHQLHAVGWEKASASPEGRLGSPSGGGGVHARLWSPDRETLREALRESLCSRRESRALKEPSSPSSPSRDRETDHSPQRNHTPQQQHQPFHHPTHERRNRSRSPAPHAHHLSTPGATTSRYDEPRGTHGGGRARAEKATSAYPSGSRTERMTATTMLKPGSTPSTPAAGSSRQRRGGVQMDAFLSAYNLSGIAASAADSAPASETCHEERRRGSSSSSYLRQPVATPSFPSSAYDSPSFPSSAYDSPSPSQPPTTPLRSSRATPVASKPQPYYTEQPQSSSRHHHPSSSPHPHHQLHNMHQQQHPSARGTPRASTSRSSARGGGTPSVSRSIAISNFVHEFLPSRYEVG
jgi:hypothetical protein